MGTRAQVLGCLQGPGHFVQLPTLQSMGPPGPSELSSCHPPKLSSFCARWHDSQGGPPWVQEEKGLEQFTPLRSPPFLFAGILSGGAGLQAGREMTP